MVAVTVPVITGMWKWRASTRAAAMATGCSDRWRAGAHGFRPSKVLLDPAARAITGWDVYDRVLATGPTPNAHACLKAVVCEADGFNFEAHPRPRHSWQHTVIYELHVGLHPSRRFRGAG